MLLGSLLGCLSNDLQSLKDFTVITLYLDHAIPHYQHKLGDERIEYSPAEKDMELPMDGKQDMRQQCTLTT